MNLCVLEWFALVPWFLAVRGKRPLHAFLISWWMGILFWGLTISWMRFVTGLGFFILLPYLGLYFSVFGIFLGRLQKKEFLLIPLLWALLEKLRGVLFGGFPWLNLSHGQYLNIPLLQWASLGGEGVLSAVIVLVNLIIMALFLSKGKRRFIPGIVFLFILIFTHFGGKILLKREAIIANARKKETLKVAIIQPNIIAEKWDESFREKNFNILMGLSCEAVKERPQLLIWPETSLNYDLQKDKLYLSILKEFAREYSCYLLAGAVAEANGEKFYNRALLIAPQGKLNFYDKVKLVPFGEYIPLGEKWTWWKRWVEKIAGYRFSFVPGKEQNILSMESVPFGVLICFEDIFPGLSQRFKEKGARILINITDDHWFGRSPASFQHLAASVLRASENRLPLVRSANTGVSAFIDSSGRITNMVEKEGKAIFVRGMAIEEILF